MNRRMLLVASGSAIAGAGAGCLGLSGGLDVDFEVAEPTIDAETPPEIDVEDGTVVVRGSVTFGSTDCAGIELLHAAYERSQERLDLLVGAADRGGQGGCNDALGVAGYRVEAVRPGGIRYVAATEHHAHGRTVSATAETR